MSGFCAWGAQNRDEGRFGDSTPWATQSSRRAVASLHHCRLPFGRLRSLHAVVNVDELIDHVGRLAAGQHGLVRTEQLRQEDRVRLRHLARRGVIKRIAKGVYRVAGAPDTWLQRLHAGVWALGSSASVSHGAAAQLHGFDRFERNQVEFSIGRSCRGRVPAGIQCTVHTTTLMPRADIVRVDGLPTTSATRTIIDLARDGVAGTNLEAAIDSAVRLRLTTPDLIAERVSGFEGSARWGITRLDMLLVTSGGHSMLERRFLHLVRSADLPFPTPQVVHRAGGRHVARVDFLFEADGVVVEVSGGRGHSSPAERATDARRRNELQQLGRLVLEFTYEQISQHPGRVVKTHRSVLCCPAAA